MRSSRLYLGYEIIRLSLGVLCNKMTLVYLLLTNENYWNSSDCFFLYSSFVISFISLALSLQKQLLPSLGLFSFLTFYLRQQLNYWYQQSCKNIAIYIKVSRPKNKHCSNHISVYLHNNFLENIPTHPNFKQVAVYLSLLVFLTSF